MVLPKFKMSKIEDGLVSHEQMEHQQYRVLHVIDNFSSSVKKERTFFIMFTLALLFMTFYHYEMSQKDNHNNLTASSVCSIAENNRFDCWPEKNGATPEKCRQRGCCWMPASHPETAPYCFFPSNYSTYSVSSLSQSPSGIDATLQRNTTTFFSKDSMTLKLQVEYQTNERLRIRLYDPNVKRHEVPLDVPSGSDGTASARLYTVRVFKDPFNIVVTRSTTGATIFDTRDTAPLIFSDQYLQIATQLSSPFLYGFGEHRSHFLHNLTTWERLVFWNRDAPPQTGRNGYGTHPFFLNLEPSSESAGSDAHGVFLLNSNAGEVALQPYGSSHSGAVTYRMTGGVLDLFILMGPDPLTVSQQYTDVVGRPYLPPFWSLGYHLCRWGYNSSENLMAVIQRNRDASMPYDVQWNDIDYMSAEKDFSFNHDKYSTLPDVVSELHQNHQRYIMIMDPAITSSRPPSTYPPFDVGLDMDVFIKNSTGGTLIGKVWPGLTAFPDFFHPNASKYWHRFHADFHQQVPFDGLWIDMNEPSNFVDGSIYGCPGNNLDDPPFVPPTLYRHSLHSTTICPSAKQHLSSHYNLHNMYGWSESKVSREVLDKLLAKRSPLISRSSFSGSGKFTGHWLGDNHAAYDEMAWSIPGILNFNLFGVSQIGADICGFGGVTTPELCVRWHQLGAFYTFMRNHNTLGAPDQDPASFPSPYKEAIRKALELRYVLLPVLYNKFVEATLFGTPIIRPLFYMYPGTEAIDKQFMWGDELLISPVLLQGVTSVQAYIPEDVWYNAYSYQPVVDVGRWSSLDAPLDMINLHIRGGSILATLPPTVRTDLSRREAFQLLVAPNVTGEAWGQLYWDDGDALDSISGGKYSHIVFVAKENQLHSVVNKANYTPSEGFNVGKVVVLGVDALPLTVLVDGSPVKFEWSALSQSLDVNNLTLDLIHPFVMTWQ